MAIDCEACQDFKEYAPEYIQNGLSDAMCTSLQNDTGLKPNKGHTDCEDLNTINDCTIGAMDDRIETFEACEWREYMHEFVQNLYNLLKSIICAICGIWTNIHALWRAVNTINTQSERIECLINYMNNGFSFNVGETFDTTKSHMVAGEGVSVIERGSSTGSTDVYLQYIGGGLCRGGGAITFHTAQFVDEDGTTRNGNTEWGLVDSDTVGGNELIYELRIKLSEYPQLKSLYGFFGMPVNMYDFTCTQNVTWGGSYAYGQHGACDSDGNPSSPGNSPGHLVPDGWVYVQLRACYIGHLVDMAGGYDSARATPRYLMGIRFNQEEIEC